MIHLVIGTPMYGGMCTSEYTQSIVKSGHFGSHLFNGDYSRSYK